MRRSTGLIAMMATLLSMGTTGLAPAFADNLSFDRKYYRQRVLNQLKAITIAISSLLLTSCATSSISHVANHKTESTSATEQLQEFANNSKGDLNLEEIAKLKLFITNNSPISISHLGSNGIKIFGELIMRSKADWDFQNEQLGRLYDLTKTNDLNIEYFSYIYDFVELSHGSPQQFGALLIYTNGIVGSAMPIDRATVDSIRDQEGLMPLEKYISQAQRSIDSGVSLSLSLGPPEPDKNAIGLMQPDLRIEILQMFQQSDDARNNWRDKKFSQAVPERNIVAEIDRANNDRMREIVRNHGFMTARDIGRDGLVAMFYIIHHNETDIVFKEQYYRHAKTLAEENQLPMRYFGEYDDRMRVLHGEEQLYWTQIIFREGQLIKPPPDLLVEIDRRRSLIFMNSYEEYIKEYNASSSR